MRFQDFTLLSTVVLAFCASVLSLESRAEDSTIKFHTQTPKFDHRVLDEPERRIETSGTSQALLRHEVHYCQSRTPVPPQAPSPLVQQPPHESQFSAAPPKVAIAPLIRFRAKITAPIDGRIAKSGDIVSAELLDTIMLPGGIMAGAGSPVIGEITDVQRSKRPLKADLSTHHWHDANGLISMHITKICGKDVIADVIPCPKTRVERGNPKALALGVNSDGDVVFRYSMAGYNAANVALSGLGFAAGPVGWIVSPVIGGVAGASDPVLTYGRPMTERDTHPRLKGMAKGIAGGLPGGYFISGAINHGLDPALDVGDVVTFQERGQAKVQ